MKPPSKFSIPGIASPIAALLALALATGNALAVDGLWDTAQGSGSWTDPTRWVDGPDLDALGDIPGGVGATADFQVARNANDTNVTLDGDKTIGTLKLGFTGDGRKLNLQTGTPTGDPASSKLILDNGGSDALITFRDGAGNANISAETVLKSNLLINNLDNGGNKGFFFTGGLSSTNGHLTITNTSDAASRTKFNSVVSDGAAGNSISYNQTAGWSEFTSANTFSGTTTNGGGLLHINIGTAFQNSALNTTGSVTGSSTQGLRIVGAGVTSLTLGGLTGNKNIDSLFSTTSGLYSQVTALTLNPGSGTVSYDAAIANGAAAMTLTKNGAGTQALNGTNLYTGATNVNAGTLALGASGALGNLSSVSIAAGGTFDLTAKTAASATYTWNTASLSASGTATAATMSGTAGGTISMGVKPISLTTDGTNPSLTVTGATLSLGGNALTVVVPGSALGVGVYTLVSGTSITGTVSSTPSYTGGNGVIGGATGVVSISGGNTVILTVTGGSLETIVATPAVLPGSLTTTYPTASTAQSVAVSGSSLTANITATAQPNFEVSSNGSTFAGTATYTQSGGTASGTLYVRLAANAPASGSYDNITAAILTSGSATPVNVTTSASSNAVAKASPTVTVTVGGPYAYNGSAQGPVAYTTSPTGDTGTPTWSYVGTGLTTYGPSPTRPTLPGNYEATVSLAADANFNAASSSATAFDISGGNIAVTGSLSAFTTTFGAPSASQNVGVSGTDLTANILATAPAGFEVSTDDSTYAPTVSYTQSGGNASGTLYVRLTAAATVGSYTGNVVLTSTATPSVNIAASGTVNPMVGDGYWILNGSDNWSNNTSAWFGNFIADGVGGTAHFTTAFNGNREVTLDSARTLGILNLSVTGKTLTIVGASVLTMDNTGSTAAQINMTSAQNMNVNVPVALNDSLVINNNISNGTGKDLQLAAISSTNGNLTIEHKSTFSDGQTRFLADISNGSGTIAFTQTSGRSIFNVANSYTGPTTINGGTLRLGTGSLSAGTSVSIAAGATFDLTTPTAASATYSWNTTSLSASGAATPATITGTALGTIAMGVKPITLTTNGTNPSLTVTGAALSLGGNQFTVKVPGTALGVGVYTLVSGASITGTVNATALYTGGNGLAGGTTGVVSISGNTVILTVTVGGPTYASWAATHAGGGASNLDFDNDGVSNGVEYFMNITTPGFTANPALNGSNTITWPNGGNIAPAAYGTEYVVQTSGNLVNWTDVPSGSLTTNTAGPGGSLTYTLTGTAPRFVRLKVTPN